jgi:hypothetical protein
MDGKVFNLKTKFYLKNNNLKEAVLKTVSYSQTMYTPKNVNQFPVYPTSQDKMDELSTCFDAKLKDDLTTKLSKINLDKILKSKGTFFTKLNFVIDDKGNFTDIKVSGNETLGRISKEIILKINNEQIDANTKIEPALVNGSAVKMAYSLPIEYAVK